MKVGVPNSFCYAGMENFFIRVIPEVLEDSQIIFSGKTTKEMVEYGLKNSCDELCIPAKIFIGHVEYLIRKKNVDVLFIPRLVSILPGTYSCPKIIGIPDVVKANYFGIEFVIPEINLRNNRKIKLINTQLYNFLTPKIADTKNILVLAHSYVIFDEFLNKGVLETLKNAGYNPIYPTCYYLDSYYIFSDLPKELFWSSARDIYYYFEWTVNNTQVDGVVYLMTFGCGIDSILQELIMRRCNKMGLPYLCLTVDEHCADVGIQTRIEAYLDMIEWRSSRDEKNYLPAHG
ncbi:acyl-CoA dehydratase activase-related protein [Anaerocellum diazotrophicum]|uniref:2-hydroxyglutaryl-CoA dehydratase n=1 Tax=Caldicellulosiruptor diazotrophicus TaxID=2806205 RepID=A0ABM7NLV2_9FIRM|nr:acyl-CoA dehydratase activase-related protein [Caldicellulosiruptor diazotrophicus]BCS81092.1 2-hydroxyglutaryl-CoA dehydratase [Caldicellulosiruptor diazotrophicus]